MRDALGSGSNVGGRMQLTILSAEILKSQIGAKLDISISCNISELPNYHCNLIFTQKNQDLGPIGFLKFDNKRPLASAIISLKEDDFDDLSRLLKTAPPRSASIFLYTETYNEDAIISRSMSGEASTVDINDLSWRYPLI
tara:strand:- start:812 stop:1231 length:420 start_codon:yes stop_codon:yes gene_type:complete